MNNPAIEGGNNVPTHKSRFICRRAWRLDIIKCYASVGRIEGIHACVGSRRRYFHNTDVHATAYRSDKSRECSSSDKEDQQREKHPRHSAHSPAPLIKLAAAGNCYRTTGKAISCGKRL